MAFGGFNTTNIWDHGYDTDLKPLAAQYGIERDDLANQRDAFIQPYEQQYHAALAQRGEQADATSANLFNDPNFRTFVQSGQLAPQQAQFAQQPQTSSPIAPPPGGGVAPPSSPRDSALQQVSQTYSSSTPFLGGLQSALMTQLGAMQQPVSANDSQLAPIAQAMRLENQRAAERKRSALAAQLNHPDMNLGSSGAFDSGLSGIFQAQGEANARGIAGILSGELARRGNALQSLLGMGLQSGDAEANRNLSAYQGDQLDRRYYAGLGQDDRHFNAGLNQNQSQFTDRMGYDWTALQQQGNLQALLALLNAGG